MDLPKVTYLNDPMGLPKVTYLNNQMDLPNVTILIILKKELDEGKSK